MAKSPAPIALPYTVTCASVQTPDGFDNPAGTIIDGALFTPELLDYYTTEGYIAKAEEAKVETAATEEPEIDFAAAAPVEAPPVEGI